MKKLYLIFRLYIPFLFTYNLNAINNVDRSDVVLILDEIKKMTPKIEESIKKMKDDGYSNKTIAITMGLSVGLSILCAGSFVLIILYPDLFKKRSL